MSSPVKGWVPVRKQKQLKIAVRAVKLTDGNRGKILRLDEKIFPEDDQVEFEGNCHFWLATCDGEPVGYCKLSHAYEDRGFLARAGVLKEFRGNGLHRRFVRVRERKAAALGWPRVVSYAARDNCTSANNLARFGYRLFVPAKEWGTKAAYYFFKDVGGK